MTLTHRPPSSPGRIVIHRDEAILDFPAEWEFSLVGRGSRFLGRSPSPIIPSAISESETPLYVELYESGGTLRVEGLAYLDFFFVPHEEFVALEGRIHWDGRPTINGGW